MNDGIFKTKRTGLVGLTRVDIQWHWSIQERAERMERACRLMPVKEDKSNGRQMVLPGIKRRT
jgi:hypothetical protein